MSSVEEPIHLDPEQVKTLEKLLADCRHNVNNNLAMIMSALELVQFKPEATEKMIGTAMSHSKKITVEFETFATQFEQVLRKARSEKTTK